MVGRRTRGVMQMTVALLFVAAVHGQQPPRDQNAPPNAPPRDTPQRAERSPGVIRGRITAADSGRPLRRARIRLLAPGLGSDRQPTTSTDIEGRYQFADVQPGRYRLAVDRAGYLPLEYGQRRPRELGRSVEVRAGETVEKVDVALPRMSVISGRITDETGEPIEGVTVYAVRTLFFAGARRDVPVASAQTDDSGEYRLRRLAPGTYAVRATSRDTWSVTQNGATTTFGYVPTFFPGAPNAALGRFTVGVGQEVGARDFALIPGRAVRVSGTAIDSTGRPFDRVTLNVEVRGLDFGFFGVGPGSAIVAADGAFSISNVPPGEYTLAAVRQASPAVEPEAALAPIVVDGVDLEHITLLGSTGGTVTGRVVSDGAALPKTGIRVLIAEPFTGQPSPTLLGAFRGSFDGQIQEDGTFTASHVFGRARVQVTLPDGWMMKRVDSNGRDIADEVLELRSGEEIAGLRVEVTDHLTHVTGEVVDGKGAAVREATVLLVADDSQKWYQTSRWIRATRPDQQGRWEVKGLPPGDYRAVALDYVEDGSWNDPEYLQSLADMGQRVTVSVDAPRHVQLKVSAPDDVRR
jgi:protocatechuate 3,4-dioxygenase beta subunit